MRPSIHYLVHAWLDSFFTTNTLACTCLCHQGARHYCDYHYHPIAGTATCMFSRSLENIGTEEIGPSA